MKALHLPLQEKWFNMIESGEKNEEYREIKPFYCNRILYHIPLPLAFWSDILNNVRAAGHPYQHLLRDYGTRGFTHVRFTYGYTKRTMTFEIESITIGKGKPEWGAPEEDVFIIKLGKRIS